MIKSEDIIQNLELISFPRLAGTIYEKKAFDIIKNKIKEHNSEIFTQKFTFTAFYSKYLPKILFTLIFLLVFSIFLENIIILGINVLFIIFFSLFLFDPKKIGFGKKIRSQNLYIKYQKKDNDKDDPIKDSHNDDKESKNILFISHVDSKGQRFSIKLRIFSYKLWILSFIFVIIFVILDIFFFNLYLYIVEFIFLGINLLSVIIIVLNTTNNKSPGALDNASGVICVLELLKHYSNFENRLNNYNLWFLFTGAEEVGTMGIRHFYNENMDFDKKSTIIINFDSIGQNVFYFSSKVNPKNKKEEYQRHLKIAKKINLKLGYSTSTFGVRSDGIYLKNKNFHGFGFGDPNSYKYIHSINDTIDKVETKLLKKLCIFIIEVLKEIDL